MGGIIMHKTLRAMLFAGLVSFVATGSTSSNLPDRLNMVQALPDGGNTTLSMMTYNIKGLPWPLAVRPVLPTVARAPLSIRTVMALTTSTGTSRLLICA